MAVLEAWAYGKPVLMTSECNLPEGFTSGAAIRLETGSDKMQEQLQTLFEMSDSERALMGRRGRDLVTSRFAWPNLAHAMKQTYDWVLGGGPKPSCMADF